MSYFPLSSTTKKILYFALVAIVLTLIGNYLLSRILHDRLTESNVTVDKVTVNILSRTVKISNLNYQNTANVFNARQVEASGLQIFQFLINDVISFGELNLTEPKATISVEDKLNDEPASSMQSSIKKVRARQLSIVHGHFSYNGDHQMSASIDVEITGFSYDVNERVPISLDESVTHFQKLKFIPRDSLHTITLNSFYLNSTTDSIIFSNLEVASNYSKSNFARVIKYQTDQFDISIPSVIISGFNHKTLTDSLLTAKSIEINQPSISVYRNKLVPFNEKQRKSLPGDILQNLPFVINIDSIKIVNGHVTYQETQEDSSEVGEIIFGDLNSTFTKVNTSRNNSSRYAVLQANSTFMNQGTIDAQFQIPMIKGLSHTAIGSISNIDLKSINPIISDLGRIQIEKGHLESLDFNFAYDNNVAEGEIQLNYGGLKLKVLDSDLSKKNQTASSLVNILINNKEDIQKKKGAIEIERDQKRFVFHLWWNAISDGIKNSLNPLSTDPN